MVITAFHVIWNLNRSETDTASEQRWTFQGDFHKTITKLNKHGLGKVVVLKN